MIAKVFWIWGIVLFLEFAIPSSAHSVVADAGEDQWIYGNEQATLDGSKSIDATAFQWTQIKVGSEPTVTIFSADQAIATFVPPGREIGYVLLFRLTVTGETGTDTDEVQYFVRAVGPTPLNLRAYPIDRGAELGCRLEWDPVPGAEWYEIALKLGTAYFWLWKTVETHFEFLGMAECTDVTLLVRAMDSYSDIVPTGNSPGRVLASAELTYTAMRNVALPASLGGGYPPVKFVCKVCPPHPDPLIGYMNDGIQDEWWNSGDGQGKYEDYWGYLWEQPYYFERIVFYTGEFSSEGGWFTSLSVQVTDDGTTWTPVPIVGVHAAYNYTDSPAGAQALTRYDLIIPTVRGKGIRIYGRPGGWGQYTSIAELEVYGHQCHPAETLIVQGLRATYAEGATATLDGTYSFSTRGPITSWQWEKVSGPDVTIKDSTSARATFTAPIVSSDTVMLFKLTAGDRTEAQSDSYVQIKIKNLVTTAAAGPDQRVLGGTQVTLDGSGSMSTTGILAYLWTQTAGPDAGITGSTSAVVGFTAPSRWNFPEQLKFRLAVEDGLGGKSSDEVVVAVYSFAGLVSPLGPGYFKDLLHMGKTAADRVTSPLLIDSDHLSKFGGETVVNPRPGEEYNFTGTDVTVSANPAVWTPLHDDAGWFGDEAQDNFIQYYHLYIISPEDRDVCWHFRHDEDIRVWNNGVLVISRDGWDGGLERTYYGFAAEETGLTKGVNSLTFKFHEWEGGNYLAVGITDPAGNEFSDLEYSFGLPAGMEDAYAARTLPESYQPCDTIWVSLSFRVNAANPPVTVVIREQIPRGIPETNVNAPGATLGHGAICWMVSGPDVRTRTLSYSLTVPPLTVRALRFAGTVSYGTHASDILLDDIVYPVLMEPRNLEVEMLMAAHLTWNAALTEGVLKYNVYRSVNGGEWEQIATTSTTSFVDSTVTADNSYSYAVSAVGVNGVEGPRTYLISLPPLPPPGVFQIREAEDFNWGGGNFPWTAATTLPAIEAPYCEDVGRPEYYDYFYTGNDCTGWFPEFPCHRRGVDPVAVYTPGPFDPPDFYCSYILMDACNWFRYGFNVTQPGWIKLSFHVECRGGGTIAAYWDEKLVGTGSFDTGNAGFFTWVAMEQFVETATGVHHLRVKSLADDIAFRAIVVGFNWSPPRWETIWADNFDQYASDADVKVAGWTIENGSGHPDAAWQLLDCDWFSWQFPGEPTGGLFKHFMMTDSDLAPEAYMDERLISPEIDCTEHLRVELRFVRNYKTYNDPERLQVAEVDIRVLDDGAWGEWVSLLHWDRNSGDSSGCEKVYIAPYADGEKIQIRWRFYQAKWDYWFAVDDIRIIGEPRPLCLPRVFVNRAGNSVSLTWSWPPHGERPVTVECRDELTNGEWQPVPGSCWPAWRSSWSGEETGSLRQRFYRVRFE